MSHFVLEQWVEFKIDEKSKLNYAFSNLGRLKSFSDNIENGRILKGSLSEGFLYFKYKRQIDLKIKNFHIAVHQLVANNFVTKQSEEHQYIIHLDFDNANNHFANLKWVTYEEKIAHSKINPFILEGRIKGIAKRKIIGGAKLTTTQVIRIKKTLNNPNRKTRLKIIAKRFNISTQQLYRIQTGENWGHIKV